MKQLFFILLFSISLTASAQIKETKIGGFPAIVYSPDESKALKTIVFIPGIGESRNIKDLYKNGPGYFLQRGWKPDFNIVLVQEGSDGWWNAPDMKKMVDGIKSSVKYSSLHATGLSGGMDAWEYFFGTYGASGFSSAVLFSFKPDVAVHKVWNNYPQNVWLFTGDRDIYTDGQKEMIAGLKSVGKTTRHTIYKGAHGGWNTFYDPSWKENGISIYDFMVGTTSQPNPPEPPTPTPQPTGKKYLPEKEYIGNGDISAVAKPGDTVYLKGNYGDIELNTTNNIYFTNDGTAKVNSFTLNPGTTNISFVADKLGNVKVNSISRFTFFLQATGYVEIANLDISGTTGIFAKHCPSEGNFPGKTLTLNIHGNYIHDTKYEGMYLGCDDLALNVLINGHVYDNKTENTGNDGIQARNGTFLIENNTVINPGSKPAFDYDVEGILIGGNTKGSIIRNNTVTGCKANAIFNDGFGDIIIECNNITSTESAIYTNNYHPNEDLQKVGYLNLTIRNNIINSTTGKSVEANYQSSGVPFTLNYTGNKTSQSLYTDAGITVLQSNNGANVTPICGVITPPPPPPVDNPPSAPKLIGKYLVEIYDNGTIKTYKQ